MLKKILAIAGRPGLYKIIGQGKNVIFVENLLNGKRFPASMRDKIMSLGDITMYAESEDLPLGDILDRLYKHQDGKEIDLKELGNNSGFAAKFADIVPDYDRDRVYVSDIKKLFSWYNILLDAGFTRFTAEETTEAEEPTADAPAETVE